MLTQDEQAQILKRAQSMRRNDWMRRSMVGRGEMSKRRYQELTERDEEEFRELLKEAG